MQFSTSTLILFAAIVAGALAVPNSAQTRGTTPSNSYYGRTPQRTSQAPYRSSIKAAGEKKSYGQPGYGEPGYGEPGYGEPEYGAPEYGAPEKVNAKSEEPCDEKVEPLVETPHKYGGDVKTKEEDCDETKPKVEVVKEEDCDETKPKVEVVKEEDCDETKPKVEEKKEYTYDEGYKTEDVTPLVETPHKYGGDVTPLVETPRYPKEVYSKEEYPVREEDVYSKKEEDCDETKPKKEQYTDTYQDVTPLVDTPPKYEEPQVTPLVETPYQYGKDVSPKEDTYGSYEDVSPKEEKAYENVEVVKEKRRRRKRCCRCVCRRRPRRHQRKRYSDVQEVNDTAYPAQPRNAYAAEEEMDAYGSDVKNTEQQQQQYAY